MDEEKSKKPTARSGITVVVLLVVIIVLLSSLPKNQDGEYENGVIAIIANILGFIFIILIGVGICLISAKKRSKDLEKIAERGRIKFEERKALEQLSQDALDAYRTRAGKLVEPYLSTLSKKKKRLVTIDDYGVPCTDRWLKEIDYFYDRVLRADIDLLNLETEVLKAQTQLIEHEEFLEEAKDALVRYIDSLVDIEIEHSEDELPEYSDDITPEDYEHFCADLLKEVGWDVRVTQASRDQGIDVLAEVDGFLLALQCKKYSSPVGNKAVQEAYSGGTFYGANKSAVVSPVEYTSSAKELANSLGVLLLHHDDLSSLTITDKEQE